MSDEMRFTDGRPRDIYINYELDDLGLDPFEFRIYARIARRAGTPKGATEGVAGMAKGCRMSERKVHAALRELEARHMVTKTVRPGRPSTFHLTPKSQWRTPARDADPSTPAPSAEGSAPHAEGSARGADKGKQGRQARKASKEEEGNPESVSVGSKPPYHLLRSKDPEARRVLDEKGGELGWKFRFKNLAAGRILPDVEAGLAALTEAHKRADGDGASAFSYFEKILDNPQPEYRKRPPAIPRKPAASSFAEKLKGDLKWE